MSARERWLRLSGVAVLALGMGLAPVAPAWATPGTDVRIVWNGPTTNLDWAGATYVTASDTFVGSPVIVPGDAARRTAMVRNVGPGDAEAIVQLRNTTINPPDAVDTHLDDLVHLTWVINGESGDAVWSAARARDPIAEVRFRLPQGAEFPVTVGYYFPVSATDGKNLGEPSSDLSFDVSVTLTGEPGSTIAGGGTLVSDVARPWLWGMAGAALAASLVILVAREICLWRDRRRKDRGESTG